MGAADAPPPCGVRIEVEGAVQGVGFRPWIYTLARDFALRGRVWNDSGQVTIEAFGEPSRIETLLSRLAVPPMPAASIRTLRHRHIPGPPPPSFEIVASTSAAVRHPSIPPDLTTCPDCLRELATPSDRRFRYPFINCTRCGPRYTIALDVPYDRSATTMSSFPLCPHCRHEYEDPSDRRFHAEPVACPQCGPQLRLIDFEGSTIAGDPILSAASLLADGAILAIKGLGGYHLACDATSSRAVERLRRRKAREAKPLAVMVADPASARSVADLSSLECEALRMPGAPIVLAALSSPSALAKAVAPGLSTVGLMLPYTPLHHLLLRAAARPLVMTSGNRSDEPMACDDEEARRSLSGIADALLQHDRVIANRCDDSVVRTIAGSVAVLRRGRGWTPSPIALSRPVEEPILACGGHLKNAFCLAEGELAWMSPHVGDMETEEACRDFERMVARFSRFVGIEPQIVAHDLHPDYFTTRWAADRPVTLRVGVQHHHAHVVSAMAEHGLNEPVLGFAWDGTGYGCDGTAWGGELLLADHAGFRRIGTMRAMALAGGDAAIRQPWRLALALLDDAFDGAPPLEFLDLFTGIEPARIATVRAMISSGLNASRAHGVGRYFDALGAIALGLRDSRYEGEVATRFAMAADAGERRAYPFHLHEDDRCAADAAAGAAMLEVDLRSAIRAAVSDILAGRAASTVSARFHATLTAAAAELAAHAAKAAGKLPVVLTGGCFQNARLAEDIHAALSPGHRVLLHRTVPPGDGGLALGQALVAAAVARGDRCRVDGATLAKEA